MYCIFLIRGLKNLVSFVFQIVFFNIKRHKLIFMHIVEKLLWVEDRFSHLTFHLILHFFQLVFILHLHLMQFFAISLSKFVKFLDILFQGRVQYLCFFSKFFYSFLKNSIVVISCLEFKPKLFNLIFLYLLEF